MTGISNSNDPLDELAVLLDTWGGDSKRWPAHVAPLVLAKLTLPGAHALIEEARALDRVIASAQNAPVARSPAAAQQLTDRILAAAMAESAIEVAHARVVPFPGRIRAIPQLQASELQASEPHVAQMPASTTKPAAPCTSQPPAKSFERQWQAAGLMAASLLAGLYVGGNLNVGPVVQELADAAGISSAVYPALTDDLGEDETP